MRANGAKAVDAFAALLLSCEHGGHLIPAAYRPLFKGQEAVLASHRGWDIGALQVARSMARQLQAPLHFSQVSRLLVDLNRSRHHPRLFSDAIKALPKAERQAIIERYYMPHRAAVESWLRRTPGRILHLSIHSFTPELAGEVRNAEIGLLYDPRRAAEARLAKHLIGRLCAGRADMRTTILPPDLRLRRNYPYLGRADGFIPYLRRIFPMSRYVGLEIEINQNLLDTNGQRQAVASLLSRALNHR